MRTLLGALGCLSSIASALVGQQPAKRPSPRPDIVLIISDDLGYGDIGSYGAPDAKTPNIDLLARRGVLFTDSYANGSTCSATRAALITGRYQQRVGLEWALGPAGSPVDTVPGLPVTGASFPAILKKSGYATGLIGKWHLGERTEYGPNAHGFDEFFGFLGGALDYFSHRNGMNREDLFENTTPVQVPEYLTDAITQRAIRFIAAHASLPFFLEVAYNATHWPFEPPDDSSAAKHPRAAHWDTPIDSAPRTRADYVKMLERMDQGVGEVMHALEMRGLSRNTLVIFTNDNGGEWLSRNAPFFHRKGTLWEGGIRVPLIMKWPAQLPAGKITTQVAVTMDVTASILSASGSSPSQGFPLDGIDLIPIARGDRSPVERDLFWRINIRTREQYAVRSGPWKLLVEGDNARDGMHHLLFNVATDKGERQDLVTKYPKRVADLRARLDAWQREMKASRQ